MAAIITPIESEFGAWEQAFGSTTRVSEPYARILSVSECQTDHTALCRILDNTQWRLATAGSCHEAFEKLSYIYPLVVFSDSALPDGSWKDVLDLISRFDEPCALFVVTSRLADESLWSEVLHLGGYDVLSKPLIEDEVLRVLDSVWARRGGSVPHTRVLRAGS